MFVKPVTIVETDDYPAFSDVYLVAVGYSGKSLKLRISHILTDGGAMEFIQTLLTYYF